jgi:ABC-type Fe3+ transport system substrate-binding protein
MAGGDAMMVVAAASLVVAGAAVWDLHRIESASITVYTTPALRDVLEKVIIPAWNAQGGLRVEPVYVAAGEEFNRLRMSGAQSEADLFLHASPLYLEKGFSEGRFLPIDPALAQPLNATYRSVSGNGHAWLAFAWSPLVEVYSPRLGMAPPDMATAQLKYGLAHPTLSNNGVYTALLFETVSPDAGEHARSRTVVQPVNARTNIIGVADGSFEVTLGYEAVAQLFQDQGARIAYGTPLIAGQNVTMPVLFVAGLVDGPHPAEARALVDLIFSKPVQDRFAAYHVRSVYEPPLPPGPGVRVVPVAWSNWHAIDAVLSRYEVVPQYV